MLSFEDLVTALDRLQIPHAADPSRAAVEIATRVYEGGGALVIFWDPRLALVQLVHPLGFAVPAERRAGFFQALVAVNHALVLPGFGSDLDASAPYFRLVLPRRPPDGSFSDDELRQGISTAVNTVRDFREVLRRVALDGLDPDQVLATAAAIKAASPA